MKKATGTILWVGGIAIFAAILIIPASREVFLMATKAHPYLMGFVKFGILATMGELLAIRITSGNWNAPKGLLWRSLIWGLIGMLITLIFQIFSGGVTFAMAGGFLPSGSNTFVFALLVSSIMNLTFAPTFMAAHRFTDTWLDLHYEGKKKIRVHDVTNRINWNSFVSFVVMKTIPLFWIPAHTITFMLAPEYRVVMAAFLSIALGGILSFAKKKGSQTKEPTA
jgi:hypothetical protein